MYGDETDDDEELCTAGNSFSLPDSVLLEIFRRLSVRELAAVACTCKSWRQVSRDEMLWKQLFYRRFKVDPSIGLRPDACSWRREYRRLSYDAPRVQAQEILDHSDQVLHVSFSHDGSMFATCSKDGYVLVWTAEHPCQLKFFHDMKRYRWKYTQFSQFNDSDSMLLVSGVHLCAPQSTSGEIIIFSLEDGFSLRCRATNKPYDVFGAWFGDCHFLSGELGWLAHLVSCSTLTLHRASQETHSELAPIMRPLYRFYNRNASTVRAVLVTKSVLPPAGPTAGAGGAGPVAARAGGAGPVAARDRQPGNPVSQRSLPSGSQGGALGAAVPPRWDPRFVDAIQYSSQYRDAETSALAARGEEDDDDDDDDDDERMSRDSSDSVDGGSAMQAGQPISIRPAAVADVYAADAADAADLSDAADAANAADAAEAAHASDAADETDAGEADGSEIDGVERLLIFATASETYSPHQVAFKRVPPVRFPSRLSPGLSLSQRRAELRERESRAPPPEPDWMDFESVANRFSEPDEVIDLHGHIIGMGVSPDCRHLYVNVRAWPEGSRVANPLEPPPIAQEIDLHVVDLASLRLVGTLLRSHKAFTPNNECFFIFLDVSHHFVASGAEDRQGYLWDRHYGALVARLPHGDVVNCVAFNPADPGMLVSVSDDHSIRVWRSARHACRLGLL